MQSLEIVCAGDKYAETSHQMIASCEFVAEAVFISDAEHHI